MPQPRATPSAAPSKPLAIALYSLFRSNNAPQHPTILCSMRMSVSACALVTCIHEQARQFSVWGAVRTVQHAYWAQRLWLDMCAPDQARRCYSWGATLATRSCCMCRPLRLRVTWRQLPLPPSSPGTLWTLPSSRPPHHMTCALHRAQKACPPSPGTCKCVGASPHS